MWMIHEMTPISLWWSVQVICSLRWMYSLRPKHNLKTIINLSRNRQIKNSAKDPEWGFLHMNLSVFFRFRGWADHLPTFSHSVTPTLSLSSFITCMNLCFGLTILLLLPFPSSADPLSLLCMSKPVQPWLCLLWCTLLLLCPSQSPSTKSPACFHTWIMLLIRFCLDRLKTDSASGIFSDNVKIWWSMLVLW